MENQFKGGINIAIKIPKNKYEATVAFYRDILKLEIEEKPIINPTVSRTHEVKFGPNIVWLDCVDNYSQQQIWMELQTPNVVAAKQHLTDNGIETCDELEQIPENMHWIQDPSGTVFILGQEKN